MPNPPFQKSRTQINWSDDDRAAVPMMPFFEEPIVVQLRNYGIT